MSQTPHGLGLKPLKRDDRDWLWRDISAERVNELYADILEAGTRRMWGMVSPDFRIDQGNEGTCVGHGCTNVLMASPTTHPTFPSFADVPSAHTYARRLYFDATGDSTYQEGAYTRDALNVLRTRGAIAAYYRLASVDEVIDALYIGPVTFGTYWYDSMFEPYSAYGNQYLRVDISSGIAGGHLYCITGYDLAPEDGPPYVRIQNSWGRGWGKNGTARITIDDLHVLYDGDAFKLSETVF